MSALYNVETIRKTVVSNLCAAADVHPSNYCSGTDWLLKIRNHIADAVDWEQEINAGRYDTDAVAEEADALVPIYTHDVWAIFTDLRAWEVDTTEYSGFVGPDLTSEARTVLFVIAERLIVALLDAAEVTE